MFEHGKMMKGEGLQVLQERMKILDPDQEEMYKFLGVEQVDGIKTKQVYERVKEEMTKRLKLLMKSELNDENLIQTINSKVIPVAAYPMNVCKMTKGELHELDQIFVLRTDKSLNYVSFIRQHLSLNLETQFFKTGQTLTEL